MNIGPTFPEILGDHHHGPRHSLDIVIPYFNTYSLGLKSPVRMFFYVEYSCNYNNCKEYFLIYRASLFTDMN